MDHLYFIIQVIVVAYVLYLVYLGISILISVVIERLQHRYKWARNLFTYKSNKDNVADQIMFFSPKKEDKEEEKCGNENNCTCSHECDIIW